MKKLILFLALASSAFGVVPVVSNITIDTASVDPTSLRLSWDTNIPYTGVRIRYGTASCTGGSGGSLDIEQPGSGLSVAHVQWGQAWSLSRLTPGALYHFCPETTTDGTNWSSGVETTYTMPSATGPAAPIEPTAVSLTFPAQGATVWTVASDCHDLQTQMDAAQYGDTVVVPAGTVCTSPVVMNAKAADIAKSFLPAAVTTSTGTITVTGHGFSDGDKVRFATDGCLPGSGIFSSVFGPSPGYCDHSGGLFRGVDYYIKNPHTNDFQLSATPGGAAVVFGVATIASVSTGADTITINPTRDVPHGWNIPTTLEVQIICGTTCPAPLTQDTPYWTTVACTGNGWYIGPCTTGLATTQGGAAINLTTTGSGTLTLGTRSTGTGYVRAWPPADSWIVVRTSTADTSFTPPGVRTSAAWQSTMFTIRQPAFTDSAPWMITAAPMAHHWRWIGAEITTTHSNEYLTTSNPLAAGNLIWTFMANDHIIFDRSYIHGLGYPDRLGRLAAIPEGSNVGFINSELSHMDYWHAWSSGLNTNLVGQVATLTAGTAHYGACTVTTTGTTTITVSGTGNGTGFVYFDMSCTMKVILPTGSAATCTTSGTTCTVSFQSVPAIPTNVNGKYSGAYMATLIQTTGTVTSFATRDVFGDVTGDIYDSNYTVPAHEGCQCIIAGNGHGPFVLDNNYISGTGILVHFDDSGKTMSRGDYTINRNTFEAPLTQMAGGPVSDGLAYGNRQAIEWKGGQRIKIKGNRWLSAFQEMTPTSPMVAMTAREGGWITDIQIISNTFNNGVLAIEGCDSIADSFDNVSRPCQRQVERNNLITNINGYTYASTRNGSYSSAAGRWHITSGAISDFVVDHNTMATSPAGTFSGVFWHWQFFGTYYLNITSNVIWTPLNATTFFTNEGLPGCGSSADAAFVTCAAPGKSITGNVVIPSYLDTQASTGAVLTSTISTAYGGILPTLVGGAAVSDRITAMKWTPTYALRADSPYTSTGSDYGDPGVDRNLLDQDQGIIRINGYTSTATTATISALVPEAVNACYVGYGTGTSQPAWARTTANTTNSRTRSIALSGLTKGTTYNAEVWCSGTAPQAFTFSTI